MICYIEIVMDTKVIDSGLSTEEKIKKAATKVFTSKGFAATKTRDIAEEADINIASLHYYFRSKENLFEIVIGNTLRQFSNVMDTVLNNNRPLHEKIHLFVERYIDFMRDNTNVAMFIIAESQQNPIMLNKMLANQKTLNKLEDQLQELSEQEVIRDMHVAHFMVNMVGLTIFPFLAKPLVMQKVEISEEKYDLLLEERKKIVPDMIINHLYLKKPI